MSRSVLLIAWVCCSCCTALCASEPIRIRVLSYNIHHGEGVDGQLDLNRIASVIKNARPDLVALQEVDQNTRRTEVVDQANELALMTEMHSVFGSNIDLQGGHYGNAILSRFPIRQHHNKLLPNVERGEQRGVLIAVVGIPADSIDLNVRVFATHFDHRQNDYERRLSAEFINHLVDDQPVPTILMGDFNDVIGSESISRLLKVWKPTVDAPLPTIPVGNPKRQIDFIFGYPSPRWRVIKTRVLEESLASDHRAILCELELMPE
ncbi:endonuclease/exonuclease/phosphatase family protein [Rhodopirellula sp. MGV]|uniref:endonuclease/exonuclease/phosphatase family protein n=1 Tax=Rhodopirellula sp. MGV TaxID=2023130 RepID=UPI000B97175E|nr:endonuclease/exonuclease/phosphatase family protein [Rhodopirellula sp. MGV]OYP35057.1 hypothetical protein CGZ80_12860 [Rhodopirellula sp. MGV]PNY38268.1 endonuclease [Rhodopirellula baltica]